MDENTPLPENPAEETPQPPAEENLVASGNITMSIPVQQGTEVQLPQPEVREIGMVESSMALSVSAKQDAEINSSMVIAAAAGRDMTVSESMVSVAAVGHDLTLKESGSVMMQVGGPVQVENGTVGLLVARSEVTLNNSRVIMTTPQALALGAAFGAAYALLRTLLGRRKK